MMPAPARQEIFAAAVATMAAAFGGAPASAGAPGAIRRPLLYGPDNRPMRPRADYTYARPAARRKGSLKNWVPRRLVSRQEEAREREDIAARAIDLANGDPHAAGIVDGYATTVVGAGLAAHPALDADLFDGDKDRARAVMAQQRAAWLDWCPHADAGRRMSFGAIQHLIMRQVVQFGEYLVLAHMIDDRARPYSLALQVIHPLRLKTPLDLANRGDIRDGVELGAYGEPVAYWIKQARADGLAYWSENSANFVRIPARAGHRWRVLHGFFATEPEQVRGVSFFAPAMKYFRDLNDYLDAELVANIVTAAFALFIETGADGDPLWAAQGFAAETVDETNADGDSVERRYQEWSPGQIMYGRPGEKPQQIAAARPGVTFEPFTKVIKKAVATSLNLPYPIAFNDIDGVSFAGFRSAMLEAWRVFMHRRTWLGEGFCQPIYTMLQEEAWLRDRLDVPDFYGRMWSLTRAAWRGAPKGDIEPIKAVKADILAVDHNLKTLEAAVAEQGGGDLAAHLDRREEERAMVRERGLEPRTNTNLDDPENDSLDNAPDQAPAEDGQTDDTEDTQP